jgi:predicted membrane-bound dolichyl-phosphate-mannose-protein mannosyltransferase
MNQLMSTLGAAWDAVVYGVSWFFGNMEPAGLWAIPALAAVLAFFVYFWKVSAPRKNSLEWIAMAEARPQRMTLTLKRHPITRKDVLPMLVITAVYAFTAFFGLGSTSAPQSYTVFQEDTSISFSYNQVVDVDKISFFTVIGTGSYRLEYSADGVNWNSLELDQSYNTLLKWRVNDLTVSEDEDTPPVGIISAQYFRVSASAIDREEGLWLGELALWSGDTPLAPTQVDDAGSALFDEPKEWTTKATYLNSSYFDEIYHARTALEHLNNVYPYEVSHPPLGKLILSLGILMFGMTPFGWRFMGTLFGVLMLPILYVFLKNLFGKTPVAVCGTCLFAFDFMHLVQTRIATIDSYGVFFILASYYFMYRWLTVPAGEKLRKSVLPLFLSGLLWGIGCACKWIVVYAGAGLAVLWLLGLIFKGREWKDLAAQRAEDPAAPPLPRFGAHVAGTIGLSLVFFVAIPVCIYVAAYIPYATARGGLNFQNLLSTMWNNQVFMFTYHRGVHTPHPYSSEWYQWIVDGRPILYYRDLDYAQTEGIKSLFASFNNPLVSWAGLLSFFALIVEAVKRKSGTALFIVIAILSQFLPWLAIGRILFAYHYFPTILFLVFAIAYLMDRMLERRRAGHTLAVYGFTGYAAALYGVFYPALTGLYTPLWYNSTFLRWFPSWPL